MSEKVVHTLLGAFVVAGLAIGIVAFVISAGSDYRRAEQFRMVFDGSVKGLTVGAPVALRGVNIGEVIDIRVRLAPGDELSVLTEVDARVDETRITHDASMPTYHGGADSDTFGQPLIDAGLRAQLNTQSLLTGLLYVQLDFFPDTPALMRLPQSDVPEVPTIPSPLEQLLEEVGRLDIPSLLADVHVITVATRQLLSSEAFQALPVNMNNALVATADIAEDMRSLLARLEPQIENTLDSTRMAAQTAEQQLPIITDNLNKSLNDLSTALATVDAVGQQLTDVLGPDSTTLYNLNSTLNEISRASRSINTLARGLEEQPQVLILGRPEEETSQ